MKFKLSFLFCLSMLVAQAQPNQVDSQGRKQGEWGKIYPGTRVYMYKGQFKNDKPIGKFTYFYKSSKVKAVVEHDDNSNRSVAYYYHENGAFMSHGIYLNQLKDSIWVNFGPSERLSNTETYSRGELHGKKVIYFIPEDPSNKSQIPSEVMMYANGVLSGEYKAYHRNLKVKTTGSYVDNKKHGVWMEYDLEGKKYSMTRFKNGIRHGWSIIYNASGNEYLRQYYYYGKPLSGDALKEKMKQLKELGLSPNG
ncbi:MAG: hypothetical protein QNK23_05530 [Crocinitomicaceae bacterium]|nr:hypothetical protein [Crocinitomicaceae bacterium]